MEVSIKGTILFPQNDIYGFLLGFLFGGIDNNNNIRTSGQVFDQQQQVLCGLRWC